ncbi:isochorismatase family protein [uncultured Brevundimonas sp.]|uniref:isochorismatase family protein n=1 Tax=uncultured Brevundimonas sp. TaxID=213418 RepID=UPI000F964927|nr:isochorismatase family protein [uncultured Brevundimonas sp.]
MTAPKGLPTVPAYTLPSEAEIPASRAQWTLECDRAALLVHDMQKYFLRPYAPDAEPLPGLIANIARLIAAARSAGVPVFYTAQHGEQDRRDRGLQADLWGPGMSRAPEHQDILPELAPEPGDFPLIKHRYSAFQRSNLETLMRARGRDQLIVCGVYAHIGCQLTAAEAFQRDIEPFFVADALGDFSREKHMEAVAWAAAVCAVATSTARILDRLT